MTPDYATRRGLGQSDLSASSERTHDRGGQVCQRAGHRLNRCLLAMDNSSTSSVIGSFDEGRDDACN